MAATDAAGEAASPHEPAAGRPAGIGSILAAALLLPGLIPASLPEARAETAPDRAEVSARWLSYHDRQPGLSRIQVRSPAVSLVLPLGERWSIDAALTQDVVSGATPRWHSAVSGASVMADRRVASDVRLNHHGDGRGTSVGLATSDEDDYRSRSGSLEWREWSDDRNRSLTLGAAVTLDRITATGQPEIDERRRTVQALIGLSQAFSPRDLGWVSFSATASRGYHSDPYKLADRRPDARDRLSLVLGWNHHRPQTASTLRLQHRLYRDTFGIQAHTLQAKWVQPLGERWKVTPGVRYHTQRAASFYIDPLPPPAPGLPPPVPSPDPDQPQALRSVDARLGGFGALSASIQIQFNPTPDQGFDLRLERYEQRAAWRLGGTGSPGLLPLQAWQWQVGWRQRF